MPVPTRACRPAGRHRLALHVGAHQAPVGVIVLQEGNQGRSHRNYLLGRHVHVIDIFRCLHRKFVQVANAIRSSTNLLFLSRARGLGNHMFRFVNRRQEFDVVGHLAIHHFAIGTFKETIVVGASIGRQRVDQTDVRPFRCLNGTYATVVRRVYITHLKPARSRVRPPGPSAETRRL